MTSRLTKGVPARYPKREELSAEEAGRELQEAVCHFLARAKAWETTGRDGPTASKDEET